MGNFESFNMCFSNYLNAVKKKKSLDNMHRQSNIKKINKKTVALNWIEQVTEYITEWQYI